jgi:hypothetical protein
MRGLALALSLVCAVTSQALAARTQSPDQPITVKLEMNQPTALTMPEPIGNIIVAIDDKQFSAAKDGPHVFLKALDPTIAGRLFLVGKSGKLYSVTFKVVAANADDRIEVIDRQADHAKPKAQPFGVSAFLRALRLGTPIPGASPVEAPGLTLPDARLRITDSQAIAVGPTLGLILTVENTHATPLPLDIRVGHEEPPAADVASLSAWTFPPRLTVKAVAAEEEMLAPHASTRVFLLLERRS